MEPTTFISRALPLIQRGIPVIPIAPKSKTPILDGWPGKATTSRKQVEEWASEWPDANVGCVASMGWCYLDDDRGDLVETIEQETGKKFPHTFTVQTSIKYTGKPGFHYYFQRTAKALEIGNCSVSQTFDFRCDGTQVVGPGSVHPTGVIYTPLDPKACIVDIPDWLVDWIEQHAAADKPHKSLDGRPKVDDEFDFDKCMEHYGIATQSAKGDKYYLPCPYRGDWHTSDGKPDYGATAILYDGERIGFSCLATSCDGCGKTFGQLIKHLNQTHEPYPGPIWPEQGDLEDWAEIEYDDIVGPSDPKPGGEPLKVAPEPKPVDSAEPKAQEPGHRVYAQCKKNPSSMCIEDELVEACRTLAMTSNVYLFAYGGCTNVPEKVKLLSRADLQKWFSDSEKGKNYMRLLRS